MSTSKDQSAINKTKQEVINELLKEKIKKLTPEELGELSEYFASETERLNESIKRLKKTDN